MKKVTKIKPIKAWAVTNGDTIYQLFNSNDIVFQPRIYTTKVGAIKVGARMPEQSNIKIIEVLITPITK